jgi:Immunoglobulin I-set domain
VVITTQPVGSDVLINTEFTVNCCVTGTGPINYYWMKDGVKISSTQSILGTTDGVSVSGCFPYYKIRNQLVDYGTYKFVAYNLVNSVTSNPAVNRSANHSYRR